jgi:ankyrin repeat protein
MSSTEQLMRAVKSNNVAQVAKLIEQGAEVSRADANGDSPLIMAAYKGYTEIVKLLLEAGADVAALDPGMKATALHAAAYAGHVEAARLLIAHGIDINAQGPYNGNTALHDAIWQNNIEAARVIIESGADVSLRSNQGETPLEMARARHRPEIVALLEKGSCPHALLLDSGNICLSWPHRQAPAARGAGGGDGLCLYVGRPNLWRIVGLLLIAFLSMDTLTGVRRKRWLPG